MSHTEGRKYVYWLQTGSRSYYYSKPSLFIGQSVSQCVCLSRYGSVYRMSVCLAIFTYTPTYIDNDRSFDLPTSFMKYLPHLKLVLARLTERAHTNRQ